jgi:hypothetical protein
MQQATPGRRRISNLDRPDVPLVSLRDAPADRSLGKQRERRDIAHPAWCRLVLPAALALSAGVEVRCIGFIFGWWQ